MRRVLWLCSWYPNSADPFTGDFIKRHAEAVSGIQPLNIVFAGKYSGSQRKEILVPNDEYPNLREHIFYYPASSKDNLISRVKSLFTYFRIHRVFIRQLKRKDELPDIVHVQVAFKAGLIALYLKWRYKIPYVLTEHWTGYYEQDQDNLFRRSFLEKYLTRLILKHTAGLITVCDALGNQIQQHWQQIPFQSIPNVVNTVLFYPGVHKPDKKFRFIHISTLRYPKNPEGIIRAFTVLVSEGLNAELVLVGPASAALQKMIRDSRLPVNAIRYTGEIPYEQVGVELRQSSALILFSYCENLPCVVLESLCTGVPVIATRVGGIPEIIGNDNGILVNAGDEKELLEAMRIMMHTADHYDGEKIREHAASLFSYDTVARAIVKVYDRVLGVS